jgi:iron complex transport system substrate-binding protein
MFLMRKICILLLFFIIVGCEKKNNPRAITSSENTVHYAKGFSLEHHGHASLLTIQYLNYKRQYLLIPKDSILSNPPTGVTIIRTPISSIACTSTSHIPLLDYLNEVDKLIAFPTPDFISSPNARARIDQGFVKDIGSDFALNKELLLSMQPNIVMGHTLTGDVSQFDKIESLGISVLMNGDYLEPHPLGRAEWIKCMGALLNKQVEADSIFRFIEEQYTSLAKNVEEKKINSPTVFTGLLYSNVWYLPGGRNYAAQLFKDAGMDYLWSSDTSSGYISRGFESIYEQAHQADLWIGIGSIKNLMELKKTDSRYSMFNAFRTKQVYSYDVRKGATGGSEFLELGYLRPDIILKDLIHIAHPALYPDYQPYFYKQLD